MANPGYDEEYAASRAADIEAQIEANKAEGARLAELLKQYAPKPKRTRKSDEG